MVVDARALHFLPDAAVVHYTTARAVHPGVCGTVCMTLNEVQLIAALTH